MLTWLRASMKMIVGRELGLLSTPQVNCAAVSTLDGSDDSCQTSNQHTASAADTVSLHQLLTLSACISCYGQIHQPSCCRSVNKCHWLQSI